MNFYIPKIEPGILKKRGLFFNETTDIAKKLYYYPYWGGEYVVDRPYSLTRDYMNAFIIFWINAGCLHFEYKKRFFTAQAGDIVFLDCKEKNHYHATERATFQFIHFTGQRVQDFCDVLYERKGALFRIDTGGSIISQILDLMETNEEHDLAISTLIYRLLGNMLESTREKSEWRRSPFKRRPAEIVKAQKYIHDHFAEKITINTLSQVACLSAYHFSRLFKTHTGKSPHQYLLNYRLKRAKQLLLETEFSIEQISLKCGFYGLTHFINVFSRSTGGLTPGKFRKLRF